MTLDCVEMLCVDSIENIASNVCTCCREKYIHLGLNMVLYQLCIDLDTQGTSGRMQLHAAGAVRMWHMPVRLNCLLMIACI